MLRVAAISLVLLAMAGSAPSYGQTAAAPRIEAPGALTLEPAREIALPIRIETGGPVLGAAMVLLYGLPGHITLTGGRLFESGVWAVPAADLARTGFVTGENAPPGQGSELSITLVSLDGTVLAERRMMLLIAGTEQVAAATRSISSPVQPSAAEAAVIAPEEPPLPVLRIPAEEEAQRLKRGDEALALSDVAAARLIFEHLAALGSADGAFKLGQTYDPEVIASMAGGSMIRPDAASAARWYAKAAAMGHAEASEKIAGSQ